MTEDIKAVGVTFPGQEETALKTGLPTVCLAYSAGPEGLRVARSASCVRGGLMGFYLPEGLSDGADITALAEDVLQEAKSRGFSGVFLDIPPDERSGELAASLCPPLAREGLEAYIPIELEAFAPEAKLTLPSAISGGGFPEMLEELCSRFGPSRLCLELVKTRNDLPMPSPDSDGRYLTEEEFKRLSEGRESYYSTQLCCRYFTYFDGSLPHFVMYDDKASARQKVLMARSAGLHAIFALCQDWGEELGYILA